MHHGHGFKNINYNTNYHIRISRFVFCLKLESYSISAGYYILNKIFVGTTEHAYFVPKTNLHFSQLFLVRSIINVYKFPFE